MILSEHKIDGINNGTVLLRQRNHDAVMKLKYSYKNYAGCVATEHATIFDGGRIVDVGPAIELHFDFDGFDTTRVLYGDVNKLSNWVVKTIRLLQEQ